MDQKAGARISQRAFIQSLMIMFVLMMIAGNLALVVSAEGYTRIEVDGRETIGTISSHGCDEAELVLEDHQDRVALRNLIDSTGFAQKRAGSLSAQPSQQ